MTTKIFSVINLVVVLLMITANYLSTIYGVNGNTVSSVSDLYGNFFTPSGYAFSIWGIIFLAQIAGAIVLIQAAFKGSMGNRFIEKVSFNLVKVNLANMIWIYAWLSEMTIISVGIMLMILLYLTMTFILLHKAKNTNKILAFSINIYWGWIAVATIANIAAYFSKEGFFPVNLEIPLTVVMILVAGILNAMMLFKFKNWTFAAVGVWAIVAIGIKYTNTHQILLSTCIIAIALILLAGFFGKRKAVA